MVAGAVTFPSVPAVVLLVAGLFLAVVLLSVPAVLLVLLPVFRVVIR